MNTIKMLFAALFLFYINQNVWGQGSSPPANATNLGFEAPNVIPASPTVASLMRFEEIPVNGYTGMPDVSIPIFSTKTQSPLVNLTISLSYHATGIGVDEIAPYTGLGWSLIAGGSISKTVRGIPDEHYEANKKMGIYSSKQDPEDPFLNGSNYYYAAESYLVNQQQVDEYKLKKFKWHGYEKGMFDTEHDLYQFNCMGISGRFYLKKNLTNNALEVIRLDDNSQYKIEVDYTGPLTNTDKIYTLNKFTITDDKGVKYIFEDREKVVKNESSTTLISFIDGVSPGGNTDIKNYHNAFHLSKILDENNNLIVQFYYTDYLEKNQSVQKTTNQALPSESALINIAGGTGGIYTSENIGRMEPKISTTFITTEILTKKLSKIEINGVSEIGFSLSTGRTDSNLPSDNGASQLDLITIKDLNGTQIKKFVLNYDYFTVQGYKPTNIHTAAPNYLKRRVLKEVKEYGKITSSLFNQYSFEYDIPYSTYNNVIKNPWGYFEMDNQELSGKKFSTTGVLKKMNLPTGGFIQFDFEPSTYSYSGDMKIEDFSSNPENEITIEEPDSDEDYFSIVVPPFSNDHSTHLLDNSNGQYDRLELYMNWGNCVIEDNCQAKLSSTGGMNFQLSSSQSHYVFEGIASDNFSLLVNNQNGPSPNIDMNIYIDVTRIAYEPSVTEPSEWNKEYLYGGGIRIKNVSFFEENATTPYTIKQYEYHPFDDVEKKMSSGSLPFAEPIYEFPFSKKVAIRNPGGSFGTPVPLSYLSKTDFNNLAHIRTQGVDVGYKYVRILDIHPTDPSAYKGRTDNVYRSPIDHPEILDEDYADHYSTYLIQYPFLPSRNYDYRRGQLEESHIYNTQGNKLKQVTNTFDSSNEDRITTGIKFSMFNGGGCAYAYEFGSFSDYNTRYNTCNSENPPAGVCQRLCGFPSSHIQMHAIQEAVGWTKLIETTTKEYFYEGSIQRVVENTQNFTYNTTNKQIQSQTITNSLGETLKTEYKYPQDLLSGYSQSEIMQDLVDLNRLSEPVITTNTNVTEATVTSELKTVYKEFTLHNSGNQKRLLPEFVYAKRGANSGAADNRITYHRYNKNGSLMEYTLADGTTVSIIWGYNGQYPIAKVERAAYSTIEAEANTLIGLSNSGTLTEGSFTNLRNTAGALVTCYIYEPMVGIKKVIPPNGVTENYEYDAFGRLMQIKDKDNKVIQKTEYRYYNQP